MTKLCLKCKTEKEVSAFYPCKNAKDSLGTVCRLCIQVQGKDYRNSLYGLIKKTYRNQVFSSIKRGYALPDYTEEDFAIWLIRQDNFLDLFEDWKQSGFNSKLKPSGDRLNDYLPYTFDNLRLITWGENEQKMRDDVKNGINLKKSKSCIQLLLSGEILAEYCSLHEAARITGSHSAGISSCCKGKQNTHNGFAWQYKNRSI